MRCLFTSAMTASFAETLGITAARATKRSSAPGCRFQPRAAFDAIDRMPFVHDERSPGPRIGEAVFAELLACARTAALTARRHWGVTATVFFGVREPHAASIRNGMREYWFHN